jgi:ArsR family metal-binding transcriptional regulator
MSNVSTQVMQSMFNHLVSSYSEDEARDILISKYPEEKTSIYKMGVLETPRTDDKEEPTEKLVKAVKQKVAKAPKVAAPKTPKKESKLSRARTLYAEAPDKSRRAMVAVFVAELGLSTNVASHYYYNVKV